MVYGENINFGTIATCCKILAKCAAQNYGTLRYGIWYSHMLGHNIIGTYSHDKYIYPIHNLCIRNPQEQNENVGHFTFQAHSQQTNTPRRHALIRFQPIGRVKYV